MRFVDRNAARGPVDLARGCHDYPAGPRAPGRIEHVQGPDYVRLHVAIGRVVAVRDPDESREMEDRVAALNGAHHALRIAHVALLDLDVVLFPLQPSQPPR